MPVAYRVKVRIGSCSLYCTAHCVRVYSDPGHPTVKSKPSAPYQRRTTFSFHKGERYHKDGEVMNRKLFPERVWEGNSSSRNRFLENKSKRCNGDETNWRCLLDSPQLLEILRWSDR